MIRSRLYWKVFANFALLLVILTAMTILTLNILSEAESSYASATADFALLRNLEGLSFILTDVPEAADNYAFARSSDSRIVFETGWKRFEELLPIVESQLRDSSTVESLRVARDLFYEWMANVGDRKMMLAGETRDPDFEARMSALSALEAERGYLIRAREHVRQMRQSVSVASGRKVEVARTLSGDVGRFITIVNVLLAVFAIALGFVLTRSITDPIRRLKQGTQDMIDGKFRPVELGRRDELGELADDFTHMAQILGNNYTRLNAYSELVTALNTNVELDQVEEKSLSILCRHTGASTGAFYVYADESRSLELAAGYALRTDSGVKKTYGLGEGIPGQCALLREPLEMSEIEDVRTFPVESGLVSMLPRSILAAPVLFQERLIGVLVLGSLSEFDELRKAIVLNSAPQIGVAVTNARSHAAAQRLSREIAAKNEELNQKNAELKKAYKVKSDFLAGMSHELRTPLNSIIGFSSVLLSSGGDPLTDDQRMGIEKVLKNGRHLLQLINDILDYSKIESGRMTISVAEDTVENLITNTLATTESLVKAKGLQLITKIEPNLPALKTDTLKVKQVLLNLLSNAVKFTERGSITIEAWEGEELVHISVKDSGIGIEKKNLGLVFEEFQQIDNSDSRKYKGTGLGLPISRRLAQMLGGDLAVESAFGKGSRFTLAIPPIYVASKEEKPKQERPQRIESPKSQSTPGVVVDARPGQTKVLCIDDDPDSIEILRKHLVPEGYAVSYAFSGDEGIRIAKQIRPDLITLDIMMPEKDGWQVLRELKQEVSTKSVPVVIHSMIDNRPLAISLGAIDVMPKPIDAQALLGLVERVSKGPDDYVLVVDENHESSQTLKALLESKGFATRTADNGEAAMELLKSSPPSIVFIDLILPKLDGIQMVDKLRNFSKWNDIPVVILSGKDLSESEKEALQTSIREYIRDKQTSHDAIAASIKKILASAESSTEGKTS